MKIFEGIDVIHCKNVQQKISKLKFDSIILDPPKRNVMLKIFSEFYMKFLSNYLKKDGIIVCYVPQKNQSKRFDLVLKNFPSVLCQSGSFQFLGCYKDNEDILRFKKN